MNGCGKEVKVNWNNADEWNTWIVNERCGEGGIVCKECSQSIVKGKSE